MKKGRWAVLAGWAATGRILHRKVNAAEAAHLRKLAKDGKLGPHAVSNLKKVGILKEGDIS